MELLLGVFWIVSGLIMFGLVFVAASQNGDWQPNPDAHLRHPWEPREVALI